MGHARLTPEHLLLGAAQEEGTARRLFDRLELRLPTLRAMVLAEMTPPPPGELGGFTPEAVRVIEGAVAESVQLKAFKAETGHMLLALLREEGSLAARILTRSGITRQMVVDLLEPSSG